MGKSDKKPVHWRAASTETVVLFTEKKVSDPLMQHPHPARRNPRMRRGHLRESAACIDA